MCVGVCPGVWRASSVRSPSGIRSPSVMALTRVADRLPRRDDQRRPGDPAELRAAGHVVVVDVGLEHVAQARATVGEHGEHTIDVALRVDYHGVGAGEDRVAPVAELWRLDRRDLRGHPRTIPHAHANGPS